MKKKSELIGNAKIPKMKKLFRMMKLTSLLLLISVTWVFANETYSQTKTLNLSMEKATVKEVLSKIEDQSEFYFMYSSKFIDVNRKVTVNVKNKKIGSVLDLLLAGTNVSYTIKDKFIVLTTPELAGVEEIAFQQKSVSGKVTDSSGSPLPGVTVLFKGTTQGTTTNADGKYSLTNIPENATLQFSFVGMRIQEIKVENQTNIDVTMVVDAIGIDEVVAIGYGTMRKSDLTGSVAQVKTENLESVPVYNLEQALKSQAAGVSVRQNSGRPGGRIEVNIRGGNSMIGNNQPLYVIDGFPVTGDVSFINPSDIESVDILKDASATAIYGARGANGVILITSKRGITGQKGKIEINSLCGVQVESNRYEMLDAEQYAEVANEWLINSGQEPYFDLNQVQNPGTDWQDFIFRNAMLNNHTLTFSGSSEKSKFSLSGNFYDQKGIIKYSGVKKGSFRLNLDHEFNNIVSLAINLNMSRSEYNSIPTDNSAHGGSMLSGAMAAPPTLSVYDENNEIVRIAQIYSFGSIGMNNPAIYFPPYKSRSLNNTIIGNAAFNINIANGLSLKSRFGLEYVNGFGESFVPLIFSGDSGSASQSNSFHNSMLIENILTYIKTFSERHSVNLMGGLYLSNKYESKFWSWSERFFK